MNIRAMVVTANAYFRTRSAINPNGMAKTAATSPARGTATLTDAQAADLAGGRWYVNVHRTSLGNRLLRIVWLTERVLPSGDTVYRMVWPPLSATKVCVSRSSAVICHRGGMSRRSHEAALSHC